MSRFINDWDEANKILLEVFHNCKAPFEIAKYNYGDYYYITNHTLRISEIVNKAPIYNTSQSITPNLYLENDSGQVFSCIFNVSYLVDYYNLKEGDIVDVIRNFYKKTWRIKNFS